MFLQRRCHSIGRFSTLTGQEFSIRWRTRMKQIQLVSQISSIVLQRRNWVSLLRDLNLSSKLTQPIFFRVLQKTQDNPKSSLNFYNWATSNLGFEPDLKSLCRILRIAIGSGLTEPVRPVLDSLVQRYPAPLAVNSLIQEFEGGESLSESLSLVLERYSLKGLYLEGLEVFGRMRTCDYTLSVHVCNSLLGALLRGSEIKLAWQVYGAMIRNNVTADRSTWSLVSQMLYKDRKWESVVRLLDTGVAYNLEIYHLVIDYYSDIGDFDAAFSRLHEMRERKVDPNFDIYASILNGACKFKNSEGIERILSLMVEKYPNRNLIIQKLCNLGKAYAAEMVFERACDEKGLEDTTYGSMLMALSKEGRVKGASTIYRMICRRGIAVDDSCSKALVNALCGGDQSEEESELKKEIIKRGFLPDDSRLSRFLALQLGRHRWREVQELIDLVLDMGFVPDLLPCSLLIKRYCSHREIDRAIALHREVKRSNGSMERTAYNILLDGLLRELRIEEAVEVFEYVKGLNLPDSTTYTIMVQGLCRVKEMRRAMKIHDEMLKAGMKPSETTYKRLISGFK